MNYSISFEKNGSLASLRYDGRELVMPSAPLFVLSLRDETGARHEISSLDCTCDIKEDGDTTHLCFTSCGLDITVKIELIKKEDMRWSASVENRTGLAPEWLELPTPVIPAQYAANGGDAKVFFPYNEGVLVDDPVKKNFYFPTEYPSCGNYAMFPNMVFTQFTLYLFGSSGLYMAHEDASRGLKCIDFKCDDGKILFRNRVYCGCDLGCSFELGYDFVWRFFSGDWMDGCELYRKWFDENCPYGLRKMKDSDFPEWYSDLPLVVTYPVRGIHDMDKMDPNGYFPYVNALPDIEDIASRTNSRVMALLMHWEGTAPWAPPYVWPPYGGEEGFNAFRDALHKNEHLLGVYCSGLGFTKQSNLIESYNTEARIKDEGLLDYMCASPEGKVEISRICTGQRSGYDLCPVTDGAQKILDEALAPLFASGADYIQALDQNHGGGMYQCYSREHGHPYTPGAWMTKTMQDTLSKWKSACPDTLLGCESASAEPFLASLQLSDNRFELNYSLGRPVPAFAYLYHTYLYNFMGNQVACPFTHTTEGLIYRMAYAASAGDLITVVLNDAGEVEFYWGMRDFSRVADKDAVLRFISGWRVWQRARGKYLMNAQMIHPLSYECKTVELGMTYDRIFTEKAVLSSAWQSDDGDCGQFFINHTGEAVKASIKKIPAGAKFYSDPDNGVAIEGDAEIIIGAYGSVMIEW